MALFFVETPLAPYSAPLGAGERLVLLQSSWDDFGFKTQFSLRYVNASGVVVDIGRTKILGSTAKTLLPSEFDQLEDGYCSLGQDPSYYANLDACIGAERARSILLALRDVVTDQSFAAKFKDSPGFERSLLRHSAARQMLVRGTNSEGLSPENLGPFHFSCQLAGFSEAHEIELGFRGETLNRLVLLAGNNGSGKSGLLSKLAYTISGENPMAGTFIGNRPLPSRTIVISYSAAQPFKVPSSNSETYRYCGPGGTQPGSDTESKRKSLSLDARFFETVKALRLMGRDAEWEEAWADFCRIAFLDEHSPDLLPARMAALATASSGHRIYIQIIQDLLVNLTEESLVLIDEPELHLHPSLISRLMRKIRDLLEAYKSYGVVATHSPIVVQEFPASQVRSLGGAALFLQSKFH